MAGGAIGAGLRYLAGGVALRMAGDGFPWGTLGVNVAGSLAMGLLVALLPRFGGDEGARLFLGVGVLGGFTTFSAFSLETVLLIERGQPGLAAAYVLASVMVSVGALFAGLALTRAAA